MPCTRGTYSFEGQAACSPCHPGYDCLPESPTPTPLDSICPIGRYCSPPADPTPCPAGTFGNKTGGTSVGDACAPCPAGSRCAAGATPGSWSACPIGHFCPEGTTALSSGVPCPAGTYNPATGASVIEDCLLCPNRSYCPRGSSAPLACPAGYFCPSGTRAAHRHPCPAGTFSPAGSKLDASECSLCPKGAYCLPGSTQPTLCPAGTFLPEYGGWGVQSCYPCEPGWACPHQGMVNLTVPCATGFYCPRGTRR